NSLFKQKSDKNAPVVFQADEVEYDDKLALTVAKGHVEISQSGQVLLADTVTYNQRTDTVSASGHVSLLLPTGEVVFADFMELRDSMNNAFAENVRLLLSDRSRLAANAVRRINGNRLELRRGVYSPCDLCKSDPTAPPAWQLKAREVSDDKELKLIEFRDAVIEVDGWPVFYTPYLSEPEPSVKRKSGFLMPSFGFGLPQLNAMITRAYLEGFQPRAMTDVNAYLFQPLLPGLGDLTQPIVLPVINRYWQSEPDGWGGILKLNANVLNIVREVG